MVEYNSASIQLRERTGNDMPREIELVVTDPPNFDSVAYISSILLSGYWEIATILKDGEALDGDYGQFEWQFLDDRLILSSEEGIYEGTWRLETEPNAIWLIISGFDDPVVVFNNAWKISSFSSGFVILDAEDDLGSVITIELELD